MSGSHAKVEVLGDSVYVTDLKSTNGTFVQDEKIKPETKTEVSLVLRPLVPPNAAGPPKADAVPSHSHLPWQVKVGQSVTFGDSNLASYMVQQEDDE